MIVRPTFTVRSDGQPQLSQEQLERFAEQFLTRYFPSCLASPTKLRATDLLQLFQTEDGGSFSFADLGQEFGRKRLGRLYPKRKHILLDSCLCRERDVSLPFVTAHEFAHWLLHRDCPLKELREAESFPDDDAERESMNHPRWSRGPLEWIEWQANALASAILVPRQQAAIAVLNVNATHFPTHRQQHLIFKNLTPAGRGEADIKLGVVAEAFGVSKTVTRIRLSRLGLYQEQPQPKAQPNLSAF